MYEKHTNSNGTMDIEKNLSARLLSAKTFVEFRDTIRTFCREEAKDSEWVNIDRIFSARQVKYKAKMVEVLKRMVDVDYLWPKRSLSFNNSYSNFKVIHRIK